MFILSNNKNPLINCERNQLKKKKTQISLSPKIPLKMHEKSMKTENKQKKGRVEWSYQHKKTKTLKKIREKTTKKTGLNLDWSKKERKCLLKSFE